MGVEAQFRVSVLIKPGNARIESTTPDPAIGKATIEGIDYTWTQREGTIDIIAKWIKLNPVQAAKAYDSVRDTFSKIGVPTEEQAKAYIAMLSSTASLKGDVPAGSIFDFSLAAETARGIGAEKIAQLCPPLDRATG